MTERTTCIKKELRKERQTRHTEIEKYRKNGVNKERKKERTSERTTERHNETTERQKERTSQLNKEVGND